MILAIPVVDGHDLTRAVLNQLAISVADPANFTAVIFDNASEQPYREEDYKEYPFQVDVINSHENMGYYTPLGLLQVMYEKEKYIGLAHNDLLIYGHGWDVHMREYFEADSQLGLIGLCGSNEIDERGGRGGGTMCNFVGKEILIGGQMWRGQDPGAGLHINGLRPACVLDSLFMMFRREVIPSLVHFNDGESWDDITLAHFYDRIWPCRTLEAGYRVAIAPIDCDHIGGMTTTGNERYRDDCIKFLDEHGIRWRREPGDPEIVPFDAKNTPSDNPETQMYLVAESRFLGEYRDEKRFIPCYVYPSYQLEHRA